MKAYIINLSKAEDRRAWMREQILGIQGIEFVFFPAISYEDERFLQYRKHWDCDWLVKLYRGKVLSLGEKACFASHYALWEECVKTQTNILVLEDDIVLNRDFALKIEELLSQEQPDFLRLMPLFEKKSFEYKKGIHCSFEGVCGTQGYYLTPKAAKAFIKRASLWFCPVDNYLDKFYAHQIENLFCSPPLISLSSTFESCVDWGGGEIFESPLVLQDFKGDFDFI